MGRIKKVATERHTATACQFVLDFAQAATAVPLTELPAKLASFPQHWPFPRGDIYHWISLLDRFDHVLELFNKEYGLVKGPQQEPFECRLLKKGDAEDGMPYSSGASELGTQDWSSEGDRELVESILSFTRFLLEHCGNRSLYASSGHLNDLLNTTSLSLLRVTLRLGLRVAQRWQVARVKSHNPNSQIQHHYNINLDRMQTIAEPFPKPPQVPVAVTPTPSKGKDKTAHAPAYNPCDLVAIAKQPKATVARGDVASVHLTYYDRSSSNSRPGSAHQPTEASPITPTPIRRTSALGPSRDRPSMGERSATTGDVNSTPGKSKDAEASSASVPKSYAISSSKVSDTPAWTLVREALSKVPADSSYDVLNRIRIAKGFAAAEVSAQTLLEIRLLAIANLAFAHNDSKFHEKIWAQDHDEPKRYQVAQQLCDLLQPSTNGQAALTQETETAILLTLDALAKSRSRASEITEALQIAHSHGVTYYQLRRAVASLNEEECSDPKAERRATEWREATFELINTLMQSNAQARNGERMVTAGIMSILLDGLKFRTVRAARFYEKIIPFFDSFVHNIPTAFQTLANLKGLDAIADLMSHEVATALKNSKDGNGLPASYKSKLVDYDIPWSQQSCLRHLLKFMAHMYEHNVGTHDRLLRNLIDTPQVLGGLRNVMENGNIFGSNVWSAAVSIMSSFIHNEPTSFQVVNEAGLVKSLLEAIVPAPLPELDEEDTKLEDVPIEFEYKDGELQYPTASGILPSVEAICEIPNAFGAICLNESGMKLFLSSKAILKYMDIFVSPRHVKVMEEDSTTATTMGQAFDELSRHHPQLKEQIMAAIIAMVKRVGELCRYLADHDNVGPKLYERTPAGIVISGTQQAPPEPNTPADDSAGNADRTDEHAPSVKYINTCVKFLDGVFNNHQMCSSFCEKGGADLVLDLATAASNPYDLVSFPAFNKLSLTLKTMSEAKPHLVLPSLIRRTQLSTDALKPLLDNKNPAGAFATFSDLSKPQISSLPAGTNGTTIVKSLSTTYLLSKVLGMFLAAPSFTSRHNHQQNQLFFTLNFTDVYVELVDKLSQLHAACLWECIALQKTLPEKWNKSTEPKRWQYSRTQQSSETRTSDDQPNGETSSGDNGSKSNDQEENFAFKNMQTLRYLLTQTPTGIESFFLGLGHSLMPKRTNDHILKQYAACVGDALAKSYIWEMNYQKFENIDEPMLSKYFYAVVQACNRMLLRSTYAPGEHGAKEAVPFVLNKFYIQDGFTKWNEVLEFFANQMRDFRSQEQKDEDSLHDQAPFTLALDGVGAILSFYRTVVRSKAVTEATQAATIQVRDPKQWDYFASGQLLVELRDTILPAVDETWRSTVTWAKSSDLAKICIDILKTILNGEGEDRALTREENISRRVQTGSPPFSLRNQDRVRVLTSDGYNSRLAREALYRCSHNEAHAREYCRLRQNFDRAPSFPIPEGEPAMEEVPTDSANGLEDSADSSSLVRQRSVDMTDADGPAPENADGATAEVVVMPESERDPDADTDSEADSDGDSRMRSAAEEQSDLIIADQSQHVMDAISTHGGFERLSAAPFAKDTHQPYTTIEDLDEKRAKVRDQILDRSLEALSDHPSISFDLAELIQAAVAKTGEGASPRADIGSTLVNMLLSLQADEPSKERGEKIAAYAHLLALILQDRDFFDSTLDELKESFEALVSWIQLEQDQKAEDAPWIEMILLIIERVLAEDEQPAMITWNPPPADDPLKTLPEPSLPEPVVPKDVKHSLFTAIVDLLPKIGKHASLALSVTRVLSILTRHRELALQLGSSLSRLFVMVRQLSAPMSEKLQGSFMIILRHMVEDEAMLRQIMQTEIKSLFENQRSSRPFDTTQYIRQTYHLALREPEIFLGATKELVEVAKFDGNPNRPQSLRLKVVEEPEITNGSAETTVESTAETNTEVAPQNANTDEPAAEPTAQPSIEEGAGELQKQPELKPPTVEVADNVMQFLLRELSNYRDVEEKPAESSKEKATANGSANDVDMTDASSSTAGQPTSPSDLGNKTEKPAFKSEEHTIFVYRCFIMQCLSELLSSYTRTKVEFINFSRKPETQPATPSKPRAGTLMYLLNGLIPVGSLEHKDDIPHRKKLSTSNWATNVIVSLCAKTSEFPAPYIRRGQESQETSEDEYNLTYVRKFVLEHALRAFKDASTSMSEPLDMKYSRLLGLSNLFSAMLSSKADRTPHSPMDPSRHISRQIGKLMFEKNFIGALTSAIADLDLNFPNAKRAVKYILNPLQQLTKMGITLSQNSELSSTSGTTDDEDISSATSMSDDSEDDEREQTPDLYRNSTLGMFESNANRDDEDEDSETDSEDDDEDDEMFGDGYDDEMDYEEEQIRDHDEVVSDEDEEDMEGMDEIGEIEGVPGDVDVEVDMILDPQDDGMDSESSSEDEDEEDEDDDDNEDFGNEMDEITGGDENASMPGVGMGEDDWEEDLRLVGVEGGSPHGGPLIPLESVDPHEPSEDGDGNGVVHIDVGGDEEYFEDEMPPEDDDEDEDDGVDYENDVDVVYEPEELEAQLEGGLQGVPQMGRILNILRGLDDGAEEEDDDDEAERQWDAQQAPAIIRGHHHHHMGHSPFDMFGMIGGDLRAPGLRSHRAPPATRGEDDGTNPLLQRENGSTTSSSHRARELASRTHRLFHRNDAIRDLMDHQLGGGHHTINVNVDPRFAPGGFTPVFTFEDRHGRALLDIDPVRHQITRVPGGIYARDVVLPSHRGHESRMPGGATDEAQAVDFRCVGTIIRWQEEARMLFGGKHLEKALRIVNSLQRSIYPAAMERKRLADAEREALKQKAKEEEEKRLAAEAAAKAEKEAQEKKEREEREAREAEEAAERARVAAEESANAEVTTGSEGPDSSMEGVEQAEGDQLSTAAEAAQSAGEEPAAPRITTSIRGREIDITELGIDLEFLEGLPEELREEVVMGQLAEHRAQQVQSGDEPSELNREFLDALPPELQRELLRQEEIDRRRRERDENRRRAAAEGSAPAAAQPEEVTNADFVAMLDPTLRRTILLDSDEQQLATLPEHLQAEARALQGNLQRRGEERYRRPGDGRTVDRALERSEQAEREASRQRRPIIQMLDKAGIATLLRLMFVSLPQKAKSNLHGVLADVCKNGQNRAEVVSTLLSILQDGSADINAVERSFAALSLRAKQQSGPKTPQPLKRTLTGTLVTPGAELTPLNIVHACLTTLNALTNDNPRVPSFFLTEHEGIISAKFKSTSKKGKGKEVRAAKFPLNMLLGLLDRKLITENTSVMETLASLLNKVTNPLHVLAKRAKEAEEAAKAKAEAEKKAKEEAEKAAAESVTETATANTGGDVQMAEAEANGPTANTDSAEARPAVAEPTATVNEGSSANDQVPPNPTDKSDEVKADEKKTRDPTPPEVPDENIRLVVNIFTARDCPSKTFQETLDVVRNLSGIPGAKEIFGRELAKQAQGLSEAVLRDLEELAAQIDSAQTDTDLQGLALANFSSSTAKPTKLLRVIVAMDYLFNLQKDTGGVESKLREEVLAVLYESSTFDKLWSKLSQCLTSIRNRGNMVSIATILLPLIESLMVVCRNTSLKEAITDPTSPVTVGTPPPESRLEALFFKFTEDHRKIINELIRNNPKLMYKNFDVLAKNSKVLEFDNKRSYFNKKVHNRPERVAHSSLQLNVRRSNVFPDSFKSLYYKTPAEIKYGKLNIRFHGEEGVDAGGVTREWFGAMARQMFNPDYALFNPVASDRTTFHPNQLSFINDQHLLYFKFIGRIIGKALYEGRVLDCHFSRAVYRRILGKSVSLKDMESLDLDYYKSLVWILEHDITDITFETFSVDVDRFGAIETIDLVPDGRNIAVTEDNKQEYVRLVVEHRLIKSVEEQLREFLTGFHEIIPADLISIFNEQELELLISGLPDIDIDDWKNNTEYQNYQPTSSQIQWFWRAVRSFDKEEKAKLLQFVTGTSKVPLNGFKELEGMNGFAKFNIHRDYSNKEKLPSSHTCFNQLDLPEYESYEHLRQQLYTAITAGSEYFGFA